MAEIDGERKRGASVAVVMDLMVGGDAVVAFEVTENENEGDKENDGEDAFDAFGFHGIKR